MLAITSFIFAIPHDFFYVMWMCGHISLDAKKKTVITQVEIIVSSMGI